MSDAEKIAAGLTMAQRDHLLAAPYAERGGDGRTNRALLSRGLVERRGTVPNRYAPAWPLPALNLTPLGLAVREILRRQS